MIEVRWHGRGGQGIVTVSRLLAEAALLDGKYIQAFPQFGSERQGAPIIAYSRIDDQQITFYNTIQEPNIVIVLDPSLLDFLPVTGGMKEDGLLLVNTPDPPQDIRKKVKRDGLTDAAQLKQALQELLVELLEPLQQPLDTTPKKPFVFMIAGVNGVGKTTSIGKLAYYFKSQGKSVLLAAGDTFRAAAREQLVTWGERNDITVIAQESEPGKKSDPAAVIFDAVNAAKARDIDIVLADTAGRLTTQLHLMEEIKKVKRVIGKAIPDAPHEVLVVLDANTGQNAIMQVKVFDEALGVTGLILTKLDGTAKGGVIAAIAGQYPQTPPALRFVGVGEGLEDLRPFDAREFVDALFD